MLKKEIKKTKEFNKFLEKNNLMNVLIISDNNTLKNILSLLEILKI